MLRLQRALEARHLRSKVLSIELAIHGGERSTSREDMPRGLRDDYQGAYFLDHSDPVAYASSYRKTFQIL